MVKVFKDLAIEWFDSKKIILKPSSLTTYHSSIFSSILPFFEGISVITNKELQAYVISMTQKGLSKRTVKDHVKIVEMVLKFAEKNGYCEKLVFNIEYPTILNIRKREASALLPSEMKKLREYLLETSYHNNYNLAILISLTAGLRIGEVTGLKFSDFDFKGKMLSVMRTSKRITIFDDNNKVIKTQNHIGTTKTKSSNRKVPLHDEVLDIVKQKMSLANVSDFVFLAKNDRDPIDNRLLRSHFLISLNEVGIKKTNFHGLRHSFASNCIASNIDIKTTSSLLGHADVKMTLDIYTHPSRQQKQDAINKFSKLF